MLGTIPYNIIQVIALTYKDTYAKVLTPDGETENIQITKVVLQCDTLAPFLFVITLDCNKALNYEKQNLDSK